MDRDGLKVRQKRWSIHTVPIDYVELIGGEAFVEVRDGPRAMLVKLTRTIADGVQVMKLTPYWSKFDEED